MRKKGDGQKQGNGMKKDRKINMFAAIRKMEVRNKIGLSFFFFFFLDPGIINISLVIFSGNSYNGKISFVKSSYDCEKFLNLKYI